MCTHRIVCQFFLIISIALTACQPQFKTIDPPAQQFEFSGFSFLSPDEKDWTLNERTSTYVNLGKLEKIDDTIVINAGLIYSPETADWDDLRQLLTRERWIKASLLLISISSNIKVRSVFTWIWSSLTCNPRGLPVAKGK